MWLLFMGLALTNVFVRNESPSVWEIASALLFYSYIYAWVVFHNVILLDFLYFKAKPLFYGASITLGFMAFALVAHLLERYSLYSFFTALRGFFSFAINTVFGATIYITFKYFKANETILKLNLLKKEVEVNQLKSQLNPHFLFNALNNIYSYNLENNSHGNELILKLSLLMRYMVESLGKKTVSLAEEIDFINHYIDFEKERLGYRCDVNFKTSIQDKDINIEPLLFFPLIENSFKYGASSNEDSRINIEIRSDSNGLFIVISNSVVKTGSQKSLSLGLENVKRRLELLYPARHTLTIASTISFYTVELSIHAK